MFEGPSERLCERSSATYDAYNRVDSVTSSDGYVVLIEYDNLNRVTQVTYPDDTTGTFTYNKLDLSEVKDRLGRITRHFYDAYGRPTATRDAAGRTVSMVWSPNDVLDALIDAKGQRTKWEYDVEGRVTREVRADNTTDTAYTYDLCLIRFSGRFDYAAKVIFRSNAAGLIRPADECRRRWL